MRHLLAGMVVLALLAAPAAAQDPDAPVDAKPYWLPNETWVLEHWLPYDEDRLYALLSTTREELWIHLRDDRRTVAEFARRRGWAVGPLAGALIAPRTAGMPAGRRSKLRRRAVRTLTQGHLAQHILFHSLHQRTIPRQARRIFGTTDREFTQLRRRHLSPLQIAARNGRPSGKVHRRIVGALKTTARRGVRGGDVTPRQAALVLGRQLRHLSRWLGETRSISRRGLVMLADADHAYSPAISADGRAVAFASYDRALDRAGHATAFGVRLAAPSLTRLTAPAELGAVSAQRPALSGDATTVGYEMRGDAHGPAHRYGAPRVLVAPVAGGRAEVLPHDAADQALVASYAPSLSHDGARVAFQVARPATGDQLGSDTQTLVCDLRSQVQVVASRADGRDGAPADEPVLGSAISADGRTVAFATRARNLGAETRDGWRSAVLVREIDTGRTKPLPADGADQSDPSISANGQVLAYVATANGRSRIAVHDRSTGATRVASPSPAWAPAVSADGRAVAFVAGRRPAVWVADVARGTARRVSPAGVWAVEPAISADGRTVAFAAGDPRAIHVANLDTRKIRLLAAGPW